mmetsp:Transcript_9089/g.19513  ORF Transcript_9089/g.19513 Transcript_9089/m.19513 type:complete len:92 (-) Transcript_9089:220-495(-)
MQQYYISLSVYTVHLNRWDIFSPMSGSPAPGMCDRPGPPGALRQRMYGAGWCPPAPCTCLIEMEAGPPDHQDNQSDTRSISRKHHHTPTVR